MDSFEADRFRKGKTRPRKLGLNLCIFVADATENFDKSRRGAYMFLHGLLSCRKGKVQAMSSIATIFCQRPFSQRQDKVQIHDVTTPMKAHSLFLWLGLLSQRKDEVKKYHDTADERPLVCFC